MDHGLPVGVTRKLGPLARYELRLLLFAAAFVLVAIPFGLLLHQVLSDGRLTTFDEEWAQWLNDRFHGHGFAIGVLHVVSYTGKPIFLLVAVGIPGAWMLRRGATKLAVFLAVTCLGGGLVDTIVKIVVGRPRPEVEHPIITAYGNSFPSGHSMQAVVCYGALLLVLLPLIPDRHRTKAMVATATWALLIGLSRLALGVHYVSDVAGGFVLGAAWLAASVAAFEIWREDRGKRTTRPLAEGVEPEEAEDLATAQG
jgi:membrane-associated phospholipid phosphatase